MEEPAGAPLDPAAPLRLRPFQVLSLRVKLRRAT